MTELFAFVDESTIFMHNTYWFKTIDGVYNEELELNQPSRNPGWVSGWLFKNLKESYGNKFIKIMEFHE